MCMRSMGKAAQNIHISRKRRPHIGSDHSHNEQQNGGRAGEWGSTAGTEQLRSLATWREQQTHQKQAGVKF